MGNHLTLMAFTWMRRNLDIIPIRGPISGGLRCLDAGQSDDTPVLPLPGFAGDYRRMTSWRRNKSPLILPHALFVIISQRRQRYPNDIFLLQSNSLRVRATARPVTLIAFNAALKKAAWGITRKTISSRSVLNEPR